MTQVTDSTQRVELLPCPFCGAGQTEIREGGKLWLGTRSSTPTSYSVFHWCPPIPGQPSRGIERIGRDLESAITAWNRRALPRAEAGMVMVPKEPTRQMLDAAKVASYHARYMNDLEVRKVYAALLSAAPALSAPADGGT
ncbi:MAG TPA: Lar family restriction alleviation protein [Vicinamibacterales bacterium]